MKKLLGILLFSVMILSVSAQNSTYSEIRIHVGQEGFSRLGKLGLAVDDSYRSKDGTWTTVLSGDELSKVRMAGFRFDILHEDYVEYVTERNRKLMESMGSLNHLKSANNTNEYDYSVPFHFEFGSMGGFYTLQEVKNELDSMHFYYPDLITVKAAAGNTTSIEGRPVYFVKISDNPNINESEPGVLYTALMHAREPEGMQQMFFFMWYLLENYSTSEEIQYLVNNLELYFIPVANPDGYEYNHTQYPGGGGEWRKNRKDNGGGAFGVDLNRNFGYNWGWDDMGSSPDPASNTYRGTGPFSEPETQIVRDFCIEKSFRIAMHYHTYSDFVLYPWCYFNLITPDSTLQLTYADYFTRYNGYVSGTPAQILYATNGDVLDWGYGEQTVKPKIISFCTEIGNQSDGFWPPPDRIIPLAQENMYGNLMVAHFALRYAEATDASPAIIPDREGYFKFDFTRYGMDAPANYTVSIKALDTTQVIHTGNSKIFFNPEQFQAYSDSISYSLSSDITSGDSFRYLIKVTNGMYTFSDTVIKYFGPPMIVFQDSCDDMTLWTSNKWGVASNSFHSAPGSITDSPSGKYSGNSNFSVTTIHSIDLKDSPVAELNYWARWNIEKGYDYVQILVSDNNGLTWTPIEGKYTRTGTENQAPGQPLYDGKKYSWVKEQVVLTNYVNKDIRIRFTLRSDLQTNADGFYFDDYTVTVIDMSGVGLTKKTPGVCWLSDPVPNPANTDVTFSYTIPSQEKAEIILVDLQGKPLKQFKVGQPSGRVSFSVDQLSPGIYFCRLHSLDGVSTVKKLIVY